MRPRHFHGAIGFVLIALIPVDAALAQKHHRATEAEFREAIHGAERFTFDLRQDVALYQEHLQRALENYGHGFYDPDHRQKLAGFDQDIRTGDIAQTAKIKRGVFASILMTAGVHLDPDPLHDWVEVEKCLDRFEPILEIGNSLSAESNVWDAKGPNNMSPATAQRLRGEWESAASQAQRERDTAARLRPTKLEQGQTFAGRATEGMNLHFTLFGVEFGREMGNVNALIQLTYSGHTEASHLFLLTVLNAAEQKTHTDTWVSSRTLSIFSNAADSGRYGHVITAQDHGDYRVFSARIADAAPKVRDWVWKSVASPDMASTLPDLERAVQQVQENRRAIDSAVSAFQQLALKAARENDEALLAARADHGKLQLPEQDLKFSFPEVRARLYAVRALSAGDPRFLAAMDAIDAAGLQAEASVKDGTQRFGYFNAIATYAAPELPWKSVQKLAVEFMDVAEDTRRSIEHARDSLPRALRSDETAITLQLSFVVEQVSRGEAQEGQKTFLMTERILRDVHWAVKGIPRREYSSEIIEISPATGVHRVQSVSTPAYIQGTGGLQQVLQTLSGGRAAAF